MPEAIGIDIGGTKVALGLVDGDGRILRKARFALAEAATGRALAERLRLAVDELAGAARARLAGIGVGCPGPMDLEHGVLLDYPTLPSLYGANLVQLLKDALGLPVWMENDADAAILGEAWVGAARGCANPAMLTVGTGIGGAVMLENHILRGAYGLHPEIGMIRVTPSSPGHPPAPYLEDVASGTALNKAARAAGFESAVQLMRRLAEGDIRAEAVLSPARQTLCWALWNVLHAYAPQCVVFGGGLMEEHFEVFRPSLEATAGQAYMVGGSQVRVVPAQLGNDAGIVGAARCVLQASIVGADKPREPKPRLRLQACADHEAMSRAAAELVLQTLRARPDSLLCLPTGHTPRRTYELLADEARHRPELFSRVRVIQLDEWGGVRADLASTCQAYLRRHVLEPWSLSAERYSGFVLNPADPQAECQRIQRWLEQNGPIDLCLLGLGLSGHVGFNEPGEALVHGPHVAQLAPSSLGHAMVAGEDVSGVYGLTLGIGDLLQSRRVLLLVGGDGKREVFRRLREGAVSPALPASLLRLHPEALCLYDQQKVA